jgi:hypothetical protein
MRCTLYIAFCIALNSCKTSKQCISPINELLKEKIMSSKDYNDEFKQLELRRKEQMISHFCRTLIGTTKILIIETYSDKIYGLIHIYDNKNSFTYEQDLNKIVSSKKFRYDKFGNLKSLFQSLDSNVVERLKRRMEVNLTRQKMDDNNPVRIYYIDLTKNSINYYLMQ